ncbi:MAG: serine/threonine-protein phosphatase [Planctomycetes bacterium]|nr:serine/threonine-protein phosphatase [Planctomycetota bacterium]
MNGPLKRRQWRKRLERLVADDPRFQLWVSGEDWLCPWCARPVARLPRGEAMVEAALEHLCGGCPAWREFEGEVQPLVRLRSVLGFYHLKRRFVRDEAWRVFDAQGRWCCPYCVSVVGEVRCPEEGEARVAEVVKAIGTHLRGCHEFHPRKAPRSVEVLRSRVAEGHREQELTDRLREEMRKNPLFRLRDARERWVCPYCENPQDHVDLSTQLLFLYTAPSQIARHLLHDCRRARLDGAPARSLEELEEVVRQLNARSAPRGPRKDDVHVEQLRTELRRLRGEIRVNEELEASLAKAQKTQSRMLPALPKVPGYEFAVHFAPCQQVSGDFYDFVKRPDGRLGLVVGDVTGHGVEAALVMGMAKKVLNLRGQQHEAATEILKRANSDIFPDLDPSTFVTVFFGLLDTAEHRVQCARAGHPFALHYHARSRTADEVRSKGLMVGINEGPLFDQVLDQVTTALEPGDMLLLYTDGVLEATDANGGEFGMGGLRSLLERFGHFEAEFLVSRLASEVASFHGAGPPEDDVTIVAIRRKAQAAAGASAS